VITEFAKITGILEDQILGRRRTQKLSDARHLYWYLLFANGFCYSEIARLNDRTHASVMWGIGKIDGLLQIGDPETLRMWELIKWIRR